MIRRCSRGLFQSLAEPNLVAESGKEASFLAAAIPVPVFQGAPQTGWYRRSRTRIRHPSELHADRGRG